METPNGKVATVVITYNSVAGYPAGLYEGLDGPVVIVSHSNHKSWGPKDAPRKLRELIHVIIGDVTPENVGHVYLYIGAWAMDGALRAAEEIAGKRNKLALVACDCDAAEKQATADRLGVPIIWCECGGEQGLARIVESLVGEPVAA